MASTDSQLSRPIASPSRFEPIDVGLQMRVAADLHLDRLPAEIDHAFRRPDRQYGFDGADDEFQAEPGIGSFAADVGLAAQRLIDGDAQNLALQVEQGHLDRGLGETVAMRPPGPCDA